VPILAVLFTSGTAFDGSSQVISVKSYDVVMVSMIMGYSGTVLFGVPAFLILRSFKLTAFYIAPFIGFVVATLTTILFQFVLALLMGSTLSTAFKSLLEGITSPTGFVWPGFIGALVGITLWVIARPDRAQM
jgi:hypothetical protein